MAKGYRATSEIQFGKDDGELVVFKPGDVVEGLTKEQMSDLWEAGVLEETSVDEPKAPSSTPASSQSPANTGTGTGGGGTKTSGESDPTA